MQGYESIIIFDPELGEDRQKEEVDKYRQLITSNGGQVVHHKVWGRRKLAYEVKKREFGVYHLMYLDHSPDALRALENQFRLDEGVLKWMSVSVEDLETEQAKFEKLINEGSISQQIGE